MTVSNTQEGMVAGPNTSQTCAGVFPNIAKCISTKRRVTPLSKKTPEKKIQLCKTIIAIADSPVSSSARKRTSSGHSDRSVFRFQFQSRLLHPKHKVVPERE